MFTGLVEDLGVVAAISPLPRGSGRRVRITARLLDEPMPLGASLAVDGVCLTVVSARPGEVEAEIGPETLSRTTFAELGVGARVHLERALRASDRLGGHIVTGHIDGVGEIVESAARGDSWDLRVRCPAPLLRYIVEKGAVALDGTSLTVNSVDETGLSVSLVPHTQQHTHLARKSRGQHVNIEVDILAKHVEKLLLGYLPGSGARSADSARSAPGLTLAKLKEHGFADND
jgi:riboflavin synthase